MFLWRFVTKTPNFFQNFCCNIILLCYFWRLLVLYFVKNLFIRNIIKSKSLVPYNLVFLFNVGPGFFLCNVGKICAILSRHLQQSVIIKKLTGPKQKLQKSDVAQTTVLACAILSGVSWVTLQRGFTCVMLSQED